MDFGWINLFNGIIVILILIPNIIWALKKRDYKDVKQSFPKFLSVCEQIGRYACIILMWLPLLIWEFGFGSKEELIAYLLLNGILILAYYLIWIQYAKSPLLKNGMILAIIPTLVFLISGILFHHWLLVIAAVLFGVSHSWITYITHCKR